jgi:hypothetical protein
MARYLLSDVECRLVFYLIKQIDANSKNVVKYRYTVKQLLRAAGLTKDKTNYLLQIMTVLFQKIIHINNPTGWTKYHWFDTLEWDFTDEVLIVRFNEELKPYLLRLCQKFTLRDFKLMNAKSDPSSALPFPSSAYFIKS